MRAMGHQKVTGRPAIQRSLLRASASPREPAPILNRKVGSESVAQDVPDHDEGDFEGEDDGSRCGDEGEEDVAGARVGTLTLEATAEERLDEGDQRKGKPEDRYEADPGQQPDPEGTPEEFDLEVAHPGVGIEGGATEEETG